MAFHSLFFCIAPQLLHARHMDIRQWTSLPRVGVNASGRVHSQVKALAALTLALSPAVAPRFIANSDLSTTSALPSGRRSSTQLRAKGPRGGSLAPVNLEKEEWNEEQAAIAAAKAAAKAAGRSYDPNEKNYYEDDWMFFDVARVHVTAGDGGKGCSAFERQKDKPKMGPAGGNGGRGGSVYLVGQSGQNTLQPYSHVKATKGKIGMGKGQHGESGEDAYLEVPLGTVVRDSFGGLIGEVLEHGQHLLVARGGRGGRGNKAFKTARDTTPTNTELGEPGGAREIKLELKLIADVGLVGVPNAGKSTLLAATTRAAPKIASYPFTTITPNLGVWRTPSNEEFASFVIADIPGLLEGAHEGLGMGMAFLRHIERCKLIAHVVDGSSKDPVGDFKAIRTELELFSPTLAKKPSVIVLNKIDIPEVLEKEVDLVKQLQAAAGHNRVMPISAAARTNCDDLMRKLHKLLMSPAIKSTQTISTEPLVQIDLQHYDYEKECHVHRVGTHTWRVTGDRIEKAAAMTDWMYEGAGDRFIRVMTALNATEKLRELGAKDGDTIMCGKVDFTYFRESSAMAARARLAGFKDDDGVVDEETQKEMDELLNELMSEAGPVTLF